MVNGHNYDDGEEDTIPPSQLSLEEPSDEDNEAI